MTKNTGMSFARNLARDYAREDTHAQSSVERNLVEYANTLSSTSLYLAAISKIGSNGLSSKRTRRLR